MSQGIAARSKEGPPAKGVRAPVLPPDGRLKRSGQAGKARDAVDVVLARQDRQRGLTRFYARIDREGF